jgi:hypothetical protein
VSRFEDDAAKVASRADAAEAKGVPRKVFEKAVVVASAGRSSSPISDPTPDRSITIDAREAKQVSPSAGMRKHQHQGTEHDDAGGAAARTTPSFLQGESRSDALLRAQMASADADRARSETETRREPRSAFEEDGPGGGGAGDGGQADGKDDGDEMAGRRQRREDKADSPGGGLNLDQQDIRAFVMRPTPRKHGVVQCYIRRNKIGTNKMYPEYCLYMKDDDRFLLCSKKRTHNKTSNYLVSMKRGDLNKSSPNYLGKLR